MIGRSLSTRLLIALVAAQVGAIMLAMVVFPFVAPFVTFSDVADATFREKIERAIVRDDAGQLSILQTEELALYRSRRPGSAFAVMSLDDSRIVSGSDPTLAQRLMQIQSLAPRPGGNLITDLPNGTSVVITTQNEPKGRLLFATTGNRFYLEDWPSLIALFSPVILPIYGPVILGALVLIPLVVGMVTRPLRRLAAEAKMVAPGALQLIPILADRDPWYHRLRFARRRPPTGRAYQVPPTAEPWSPSLGIRLSESGMGMELQLLARAVNEALERIEQGVARQRLYAANAAHELRTPIAILGLHIDQLGESELKTKLQSDKFRIQTLVEQLVTVARLGQNHVPMDEAIDLVSLLRDVVADRAPIAIKELRALEVATEVPALGIRGNRQALFSALANIVDNAIRAEPAGGVITVRLKADGQVLICDHGPGIAIENRAKIFEPFWRGPSTLGGAGLGLAIVKEIADRHGIQIDIGDTEGGGATFRLHFNARPDDGGGVCQDRTMIGV